MTGYRRVSRGAAVWLLTMMALAVTAAPLSAQQPRFLAKEDIIVLGLGLRVEPAQQTVPRDVATIVSAYLEAPVLPSGLPPFAPDAEVRATLRGPSFAAPRELVTRPNTPFTIPPLTVVGLHTLENIRLVSGGQVLLYGTPDVARIEVIDRLLLTQVTARPLTAEEIRAKGIVFNKDNFQAYSFTAAFAVGDGDQIRVSFPVVLPALQAPANLEVPTVDLSLIEAPLLKDLRTLIPDTLEIQTRIPNLSVTGFALTIQGPAAQDFFALPIPGVIVIPGDVAFLNQYFSVMLLVSNIAPLGSNLVVRDLHASIVLPPGADNIVGSSDDPLRMAMLATGESPRVVTVVQAGPDGRLGTFDDVPTLAPGESGNAEFLVEGRREGTFTIEMELDGTLVGLPVGPVPIRGRAAGSVSVRNPRFTLTFTHPEIVNAGEPYTLDVTVTNTSDSPANFVTLSLDSRNVSGAILVGQSSFSFDTIPPGDSASVTFDLVASRTGRITAAALDSSGNLAGRFQLKTAVGEFGVPLSPDSLVLPKEAGSLPRGLRDAALGLLGRAYAVATAPASAFPKDLIRFSKQIVFDRAVEVAEAGFRHSLGEPIADAAGQLLMDFAGSNFARLPERVSKAADLPFVEQDYRGFDLVRRLSFRGDVFADAIGQLLAGPLLQQGATAFHRSLAEQWSYRPGHISVLVASSQGGAVPVNLAVVDGSGRVLGGGDATKITKDIPFSDFLLMKDGAGTVTARMALVAVPEPGTYTIRLDRLPGADPAARYTFSLVFPAADGLLRHMVLTDLGPADVPSLSFSPDDPYRFVVELTNAGMPQAGVTVPGAAVVVADPPPSVIGVVQMADADRVGCSDGATYQAGRIVAVLFSEEVTPESIQDKARPEDIVSCRPEANLAVGIALQTDRRIAFIGLRKPVGPFIPRTMTIEGVTDRRGQMIVPQTVPIRATVTDPGGVVTGQVLRADGTPVANADVRLFYEFSCERALLEGGGSQTVAIGISQATADDQGRFTWDYVVRGPQAVKLTAFDAATNDLRSVRFTVARDAQRLNVNIVFIGKGTFRGRTLAEDGRTPLAGTVVRVTSLTDQSQYGATTDTSGGFEIPNVPVGNLLVEAVNAARPAQVVVSEAIPFAGAIVSRDLVLFDIDVTGVTITYGRIGGHVLRADGTTAVADVPVVVYYQNRSQIGVRCPPPPGSETMQEPAECAIAVGRTDGAGAFSFSRVTSGSLRVYAFDQVALAQGEVRVALPAGGSADFNLLLAGGLGVVRGIVVDPGGEPVTDARVGGGLSLTSTDALGRFVLPDVPVGRREIVAVSDTLGTEGRAIVDIVQAGEEVNTTIVLESVGAVAGIVRQYDGSPARDIPVYVFHDCYDSFGRPQICVDGTTTTDAGGAYRVSKLKMGQYTVSAFRPDLADGNLARVSIQYFRQVVRADLTFRGGGGRITGVVYAADGVTPLKARVSVSGQQLVVADGKVGVRFEYVSNYQVADTDFTTGAFTLSKVWVGPFTLRAVGQFSPDPVALEGMMPSAGATVTMNLRLQPTSRITGTIYQPNGVAPVGRDVIVKFKSDAFLVLCTEDVFGIGQCTTIPQGIQEEFAVTDELGRFAFPIVNAGSFTVTADDPATGRTAQVKGSVRAGETADISLRLLASGTVIVRARSFDGQSAIPGARVEIKQLGYPNQVRTALAGPDGDATFSGGDALAEGPFVVAVTDLRDGRTGRGAGAMNADGETVVIEVRVANAAGTVTGTVYRPDGLTPVPNAEVVIGDAQGPLAFAVTGSDGVFVESGIALGGFTVEVFDPATAQRGRSAGRIDYAGQTVPANVRLDALGLLRGVVIDARSREPLRGWEVTLRQTTPSGRQLPELRTTSTLDGSFSFPGASIGSYRVDARNRTVVGTGSASGEIVRAGEIVDVVVAVGIVRPVVGQVEGHVYNPDGSSAGSAQVELCASAVPCRTTTADPSGAFAFAEVPLGRFTVSARAQLSGNLSAGTIAGTLLFEGDTLQVSVTLAGLGRVTGVVVDAAGEPVPDVIVRLYGQPASGCAGPCSRGTGLDGRFDFPNVPARTFTVVATDPVSGLEGSVGDTLNPGQIRDVRVVLQPSATLQGQVLLGNGSPATGIVAELARHSGGRLYVETAQDGTFLFQGVPLGAYTLTLQDPIGPGFAKRTGVLLAPENLGIIVLDEAPPAVAAVTPAGGTTGVPLDQIVHVGFTEPVDLATVTTSAITLTGPSGTVPGIIEFEPGDAAVTFRPLGLLSPQSSYTIRIAGIADRAGRAMTADFVSVFTTVDLTPPSILQVTPEPSATGVPVYTTVRVRYSETINPSSFRGPPITVTGPAGGVAGRIDYLLGATTIVFSPLLPLAEGATFQVQVEPATDLAGNRQVQGAAFQFTTTDRTPPQLASLTVAGGYTVIENTVARVDANVAAGDVAFVDFFINGQFVLTDRDAPFSLAFQAIPSFGRPGDQITVSGVPVDTSGNRGAPATTVLTVIADEPPTVVITSPPVGFAARNGASVIVTVRATDDVGVTQLGFKAATGDPRDAARRAVPAAKDETQSFAFVVPATTPPGALSIEASAVDTKGQVVQAQPVAIQVVDGNPPVVMITGATSGQAVSPGQTVTVVVTASDPGGVSAIRCVVTGAAQLIDVRPISPPQPSPVTTFAFTVPETATGGQSVFVDALATDQAGNTGAASRVVLPVGDVVSPTVRLRPASGRLDMVAGRSVSVIAEASDGVGVSRVTLAGSGAFSLADARAVSPPSRDAQVVFVINVPESVPPGAVLALTAQAFDTSENGSIPASLSLTAVAMSGVTLPPSLVLRAGETVDMLVELSEPAPPSGLTLDFLSAAPSVVEAPPPLVFAGGERSRSVAVRGLSGGTAAVRALIAGVERATMTVTVIGGVVRGVVLGADLAPVAGAQVSVFHAATPLTTTTSGDGSYLVEGVTGLSFTVRAIDPQAHLLGQTSGSLSAGGGWAVVNVVLLPAGAIDGIVVAADGTTRAGAGVRIDLFDAAAPGAVIATTFTDADAAWSFALVAQGSYIIEASDVDGNRGRATASLSSGQLQLAVTVAFLGRGTVTGTVRTAMGTPAANATVELRATSLFGVAPVRTQSAGLDGSFAFDRVFVGTYVVSARDPVSNLGGSASGSLAADGATATADITLAPYANLRGTVFRSDGVTAVGPGVSVTFDACTSPGEPNCQFVTQTDGQGLYQFYFLPFRPFSVRARDAATRGIGVCQGSFSVVGETRTLDVTLAPQGTLLVTVTDGGGTPVAGAFVRAVVTQGALTDELTGSTSAQGIAPLQHLLAGQFVLTGMAGGLDDQVVGDLLPGEVKAVTLVLGRRRLVSIAAEPGTIVLGAAGQTQPISVIGRFSDGSTETLTGGAVFSSSNPAVASVSQAGVVTAGTDGSATIAVEVAGVSPVQVAVTVRSITGITIDPATVLLFGSGKTVQLTVMAWFADGGSAVLSSGVLYESSAPAVATVNAAGLVTSVAPGTAVVTARFGMFAAQRAVTVEAIRPVDLVVVPPGLSLTAVGQTAQLVVSYQYTDGTTGPVTDPIAFVSRDTLVVTVNASGLVTAVANGSTQIDVSAGGFTRAVTAVVEVPVTNPPPVITGLGRAIAGEGDTLVILGRNFDGLPARNRVFFGDREAVVQAAMAERLVAIVPKGAASGSVQVVTNGQASNVTGVAIYPRRAQGSQLTSAFAVSPPTPGQAVELATVVVDVRQGDQVWLTGSLRTIIGSQFSGLPGPAFGGSLILTIGGLPQVFVPSAGPIDLTPYFSPGEIAVTGRLEALGGQLWSGELFLVSGPPNTGLFAGEWALLGDGTPQQTTIRFRPGLPDGSKVAVTVANWQRLDGSCCTDSAGGEILNGVPTPNDSRFRTFEVVNGEFAVVYSDSTLVSQPFEVRRAVLSAVTADVNGYKTTDRPFTSATVLLPGTHSASVIPADVSLLADGGDHPLPVRIDSFRDSLGYRVPDGSRVALTVVNWQKLDGSCCTDSVGGRIANGDTCPNDSRFKAFTITGGAVEAVYSPIGLAVPEPQTWPAVIVAIQATVSNARALDRPYASGLITLSSASGRSLQITVQPPSLVATALDNRSLITIDGFADASGRPVPDGTKIAMSTANWQRTDGSCCTDSAGGVLIGGTPAANDSRFKVYETQGGRILVEYSAQGLVLGPHESAKGVVVLVPADPANNRIGDRPLAAIPIQLVGVAQATIVAAQSSVLADGVVRSVPVLVSGLRDALGNPVPDGTRIALTATNWQKPDGSCCTDSVGGTFTGGVQAVNDTRFQVYTVTNGVVEATYTTAVYPGATTGISLPVTDVRSAVFAAVIADGANARRHDRPFATGRIILSSTSRAEASVAPASLLADSQPRLAILTVTGMTDSQGLPVPDGTKVSVSAVNWQRLDGSCCTDSVGGTMLGGVQAANDSRFRVYEVQGGQFQAVYSSADVFVDTYATRAAVMVLLPADGNNNRIGDRPFASATVTLAGFGSGAFTAPGQLTPGGVGVVVLENIRDALGNPVPDGTRIGLTSVNWARLDGSCCTDSTPGIFLDGMAAANDSRFRIYTVTDGRITATFQAPAQSNVTSVIVAVPADGNNNKRSDRPFASVPIAIRQ